MTLYYYEEATMKEIGLILGVAESRVSEMHASALLHLRVRLSARRTLTSHDMWKRCEFSASVRDAI
jgi:DNA-directed RNA polymerase sigma subunit (sigma70/sigma32)